MRRPHLLRVPSVAVKALGEAGSRLLLDDARVIPAKLAEDGFVWAQPRLGSAHDHGRGSRDLLML
jgi:NAD dependent epimerase/dehydratase family enzyme